jgi:hypothetical protein
MGIAPPNTIDFAPLIGISSALGLVLKIRLVISDPAGDSFEKTIKISEPSLDYTTLMANH